METVTSPQTCAYDQLAQFFQEWNQWKNSLPQTLTDLWAQWIKQVLPSIIDEMGQKPRNEKSSNILCAGCQRSLSPADESSPSKSLKLKFKGTMPVELWTFDPIQPNGGSLTVELLDSCGSRVEVGPESGAKIQICVLLGNFKVEDGDHWTTDQFDKNVAQPRKHNGPLLKGECEMWLKNGIASFDLSFTANSKYSDSSGEYRLGAKVIKGLPHGVEIGTAVSGSFKVKEHRTKPSSIYLGASPTSLKHIGPKLADKLADKNITTVLGFLRLYSTDSKSLNEILRLSANRWKELVTHIGGYQADPEVRYKYTDNSSGTTVVLDDIFKILGIFSQSIYKVYNDLDDSGKELAEKIRQAAYKNQNKLHPWNPDQKKLQHRHFDAMEADVDRGPTSMECGGQDFHAATIQEGPRPSPRRPSANTTEDQNAMDAEMQHRAETAPVLDPNLRLERGGQEYSASPPEQTCQDMANLSIPQCEEALHCSNWGGQLAEGGYRTTFPSEPVFSHPPSSSEPQGLLNQPQNQTCISSTTPGLDQHQQHHCDSTRCPSPGLDCHLYYPFNYNVESAASVFSNEEMNITTRSCSPSVFLDNTDEVIHQINQRGSDDGTSDPVQNIGVASQGSSQPPSSGLVHSSSKRPRPQGKQLPEVSGSCSRMLSCLYTEDPGRVNPVISSNYTKSETATVGQTTNQDPSNELLILLQTPDQPVNLNGIWDSPPSSDTVDARAPKNKKSRFN